MLPLHSQDQVDSDKREDAILEQLNKRILDLARKKIARSTIRIEELDLEIDELAQRTRIKLWQALGKGHVINPVGYVNTIIHNEVADRHRRYKPTLSLTLFSEDTTLPFSDMTEQDPQESVEQDEAFTIRIARIAEAIVELPPRQKLAVLCSLKDAYDDTLPLLLALEKRGIEIKSIVWPDNRTEVLRLKASLTVARKKLRRVCCL